MDQALAESLKAVGDAVGDVRPVTWREIRHDLITYHHEKATAKSAEKADL